MTEPTQDLIAEGSNRNPRELPSDPSNRERRGFFKKLAAAAVGTVVTAVPLGAGMAVLLDPLRSKAGVAGFVRVTTLDALPADGRPQSFPVYKDQVDAWNVVPHVPVGAVYLRLRKDKSVEALNAICPHAGCFVDFLPRRDYYHCPCHGSTFTLTGAIRDPDSPAPRPMDTLKVQIRNGGEVWVQFENFETGHAQKIPVA